MDHKRLMRRIRYRAIRSESNDWVACVKDHIQLNVIDNFIIRKSRNMIPSEQPRERILATFFMSQFMGIAIGCVVIGAMFEVTRSLTVSLLPYETIALPVFIWTVVRAIRRRSEQMNRNEKSKRKVDWFGVVIGFCLWTMPVVFLVSLVFKLPFA